ncbi:hypothetical protein CAS74_002974 [Pichia kudriavzevii]|uniref:GRIP domain-containing protein n=1 Tax=Pichia kudriavzevii TaxID=4909 RepID=A0A1Z8JN43_PICKU|nr:hypothetical protein CAS74_002974 [Pichia kudriavzevii]
MKHTIEDQESKICTLELSLNEAKANEEKLEAKNKKLREEVSSLKSEIEKMEQDGILHSSLKSDFEKAKLELSKKEKLLLEAENKIKFIQEEKSKINDSIIELKVQNKELKQQKLKFEDTRSGLCSENEKFKNELNESTLRINKLSLENTKLVKLYEELNDKYEEAKNFKSNSSSQVESLRKRVDELSMQNNEYENRIDMIQEELTQSRNMLQERNHEMGTLRKMLMENEESQAHEIKQLKSKYDRLLEEKEHGDSEHMVLLKNKQREIDELKRSLEKMNLRVEEVELHKNSLMLEIEKLHKTNELPSKTSTSKASSLADIHPADTEEYNSKVINTLRVSLKRAEKRLKEIEDINSKLRVSNQESSEKLIRLNKKYKLLSQQYKRRLSDASASNSRKNSSINLDEGEADVLQHEPKELSDTQSEQTDVKEKVTYIKNVLFGFLEHKEQRKMLLPVIKMLLYMSDDDTKRLTELLE